MHRQQARGTTAGEGQARGCAAHWPLLRATEAAALAAGRWFGRGDLPLYNELGPENGKGYQEVAQALNGQDASMVRITDRGPFVDGRIIDLSRAAAKQISMLGPGTEAAVPYCCCASAGVA